MSLFQRRHFRRIAEIVAEMDINDAQLDILCNRLHSTNWNFNETRFRNYVEECN